MGERDWGGQIELKTAGDQIDHGGEIFNGFKPSRFSFYCLDDSVERFGGAVGQLRPKIGRDSRPMVSERAADFDHFLDAAAAGPLTPPEEFSLGILR